jgi:hypothetical protein
MTMNANTIITLADAARSFLGDELTRNQLKVYRARLRRQGVTPRVVMTPVNTDALHYVVNPGTDTHTTLGEHAYLGRR